jgi:hypothetical protein
MVSLPLKESMSVNLTGTAPSPVYRFLLYAILFMSYFGKGIKFVM